jgi:hypothetical protein
MTKVLRAAEVEALLREIRRYLAYVDAFRTADRRPPPAERKRDKEK